MLWKHWNSAAQTLKDEQLDMSILPDSQAMMEQLYDEYSCYVYKIAWQYCTCHTDVEDLVQEVWIRFCVNPHRLYTLSKPRQMSYISSTVRNTAISLTRNSVVELPLETAQRITYCEAEILNRVLDRKISASLFRQIWPRVPQPAREILERKYFLDESDAEIATALGIRSNSVRMYITRARRVAFAVLAEHKDMLL